MLNSLSSLAPAPMAKQIKADTVGKGPTQEKALVAPSLSSSSGTTVSATHGATETAQVSAGERQNPFAATILTAIQSRLWQDVADGASQEQLQSRLEAGLEGFLKGFQEASDILAHMGLLNDGVAEAIGQTHRQVLQGLMDVAQELGLELDLESHQLAIPVKSSSAAPEPLETEVHATTVAELIKQIGSKDHLNGQLIESLRQHTTPPATYEHLAKPNQKSTP